MQQPAIIVGLFPTGFTGGGNNEHQLQSLWRDNLANGYNFAYVNISKDLSGISVSELTSADYYKLPHAAFSRKAHSDLAGTEWHSFGGMMTNVPAPDLNDELATAIFDDAAQWAKYLGMHSICFDLGRLLENKADQRQPLQYYAELIARVLHKTVYEGFQFWIKTPWTNAGWELWNELRNSIGQHAKNRLHVIVDLGTLTNSEANWNERFARWYGESIQAIALPTSLFHDGEKDMALNPAIQNICRKFLAYPEIKWLIEGSCHKGHAYSEYRDYLESIKNSAPFTDQELFLLPSVDVLQRPMQPLQDQLHSSNYELFEKEPFKHAQYEAAIRQALLDRHKDSETVTLMVLGAGRGPLVDCSIRAAEGLSCKLKIFVIEKNPPAVVTLKHRARDDWSEHDVTIIETDMRDWSGEDKADIIVSELLGSWGDNELSPECLDGAQHLLKDDGISIPASYTSYISPITSSRLHAYTGAQAPYQFPDIGNRKFYETTYVVLMESFFKLASEQACFTFKHPNAELSSNERYAECTFSMPKNLSHCLLHGFRGTFDCTLYEDIHISIAENNYSEGMYAWFPLYIPLESPLTLKGGEDITVFVWRRVSKTKVWYEWSVKGLTHIHNNGGRSSSIGLF